MKICRRGKGVGTLIAFRSGDAKRAVSSSGCWWVPSWVLCIPGATETARREQMTRRRGADGAGKGTTSLRPPSALVYQPAFNARARTDHRPASAGQKAGNACCENCQRQARRLDRR